MPTAIQRIEDISGATIFEADTAPPGVQIISPQHAYLVTNILSDPSVKLSPNLTIPGWEAAAKTGTTNDNRDVWTVGYTTELAVGVWVGRTDNQPMGSTVYGSNTAAPIWNKTMQAGLAGLPAVNFAQPEGITVVTVCVDTGAVFDQATCPSGASREELVISNQPPPAANQSFVTVVQVDGFSGLLANENCTDYVESRSFINIEDQTAISWINDTVAGQAWAEERGIEVPIAQPPTEACAPGMPRPQVVLTAPFGGQEVSGLVEIRGTVNVPNFENYEFRLANADVAPDDFSGAIGQVYHTPHPEPNALLGSLDFSTFPTGNYILRVAGRADSGAEAVYDVTVFVNNTAPPVQPSFTPTATQFVPIQPTFTPTQPEPGQGGAGFGDPLQPVAPTPEGQ